jgi:hypothetical protein
LGETASGGGLSIEKGEGSLSDNTIRNNSSSRSGGGLNLDRSTVTLNRNTIVANVADEKGGGMWLGGTHAELSSNRFISNSSGYGSVTLEQASSITLDGDNFFSNEGSGLFLANSQARVINTVIADNYADKAVTLIDSSAKIMHSTIARNNGEEEGTAIYARDYFDEPSSLLMTNTIIVSHTTGVDVGEGVAAALEATLWGSGDWTNDTDWDGEIITGTINIWEDPAFVAPDEGDYHITLSSGALGQGVSTGVTEDMDNEPRPRGKPDLGADEYWPPGTPRHVYLPAVQK